MALKSPDDPDDQIYEHLVQSSDSAIPPKELPSMYILTAGPEGDLRCLHRGLNSRVPLPLQWQSVTQVHLLPPCNTPWHVWQEHIPDTTKKGIATEAKFNYGTEEHPNADVYHLAHGRRLEGFSRIQTIDGAKHALVENS